MCDFMDHVGIEHFRLLPWLLKLLQDLRNAIPDTLQRSKLEHFENDLSKHAFLGACGPSRHHLNGLLGALKSPSQC